MLLSIWEVCFLNVRIRELRKSLGLSGEKFGERIGIKKNTLSAIETGRNNVTDQMFKSICREFNVNEDWLRTGQGEMFNELPEEDEVALIVSELLEEDNPFYQRIKNAVKIYMSLSPQSQDVINDFVNQLFEHEKKED